MLAFGAAGGEQDASVGEDRTHAMGDRPSAANSGPTEPVEELQALFFEENLLALADRQAHDERPSLRPPDKHHGDDDEGDDDGGEQRGRHRRIVRPSSLQPANVRSSELRDQGRP